MSTNQAIINAALQELGVIESGEDANATDSATALNTLNNMMEVWRETGRDLNWFPQDTLTDEAPLERWVLEGVVSCLAIELAPNFRSPITGDLVAKAMRNERAITNRLMNTDLTGSDMSHMPQGERYRYDIETDR